MWIAPAQLDPVCSGMQWLNSGLQQRELTILKDVIQARKGTLVFDRAFPFSDSAEAKRYLSI